MQNLESIPKKLFIGLQYAKSRAGHYRFQGIHRGDFFICKLQSRG